MTIIFLVRHGNTDWTGKRLIGATPGIHLNEIGRAQAQKVSSALAENPILAIYASPLERALETATPLAAQLHLSVEPVGFLKEVDFGKLRGLGPELAAVDVWSEFSRHPARVVFPDGESVAAAQRRIVNGLNQLSDQYDESAQVVCVAHCEILRLAVAHALKVPLDEYMRLTIDPGSLSALEWTPDHQVVKFLNLVPA